MAPPARRPRALLTALACIIGGCVVNVVVMEHMLAHPAGHNSGKLITFGHFLFIAAEGVTALVTRTREGRLVLRPRRIPLFHLLLLVGLFWGTNVTNNVAFSYRLSVPLHTVFRSLQLFTSMALGALFVGKSYAMTQVLAVALVTTGVGAATWASVVGPVASGKAAMDDEEFLEWLTGMAILMCSVVLASLNGLAQEAACVRLPKVHLADPDPLPQWKEVMVYMHLLGLPVFLVFFDDLRVQLTAYVQSPLLLGLWGINMVTQWLCISGVLNFTQLTDSLTLTMVITLRKMLSLLISVFFFENAFTPLHWLAALMTFGGGLLYGRMAQRLDKDKAA